MIETCTPYACPLVVAFGALVGVAALFATALLLAYWETICGLPLRVKYWWLWRQVEKVYPGWREVVMSSSFERWFRAQPADVRALGRSENVKDAIEVMRLYFAR